MVTNTILYTYNFVKEVDLMLSVIAKIKINKIKWKTLVKDKFTPRN